MDHPFQPKRVLLIDDEADLREIYSLELYREGFEVLLASDGEEGLALMHSEKPDAVLLDLQMPKKNGIDVLRAHHTDPAIQSIPIVVLSNTDEEKTYKQVGKFNTRFFLVKAFTTPGKVAKILREVIP